jgi:hypothetical protein
VANLRRYWVWILAVALVLGTAAVWRLARGPASAEGPARTAVNSGQQDARLNEVRAVARQPRAEATRKLVELYAQWAQDPNAIRARRLALEMLLAEPALALRLKRVLEAVVADRTPPERDPLWTDIVENLAEQWTPETFDKGRDLMLMEQRPRARRALVESFTEFAETDQFANLTAEQRAALINDLIDMYPHADPQQKSQIEATLRKIASDDVADLLSGRGINDGHKLKIREKEERELQAGMKAMRPRAQQQ